MTDPYIVARSVIGVPVPSPTRPRLRKGLGYLLCHYTGAGTYNDPTKDDAYARSVAAYGISAGKTYEYNYLIGLGGKIYEQAGDLQAAHCLNLNADSIGVLFMIYKSPPSPAMIDSFRWLRWWLTDTGRLRLDHQVTPHYRFRQTSCCGPNLAGPPGAKWASPTGQGQLGNVIPALLTPWHVAAPTPRPEVPPTPIIRTEDEPDMKLYRKVNELAVWCADGKSRWHVNSGENLDRLIPFYGQVILLDESADLNTLGVPGGALP